MTRKGCIDMGKSEPGDPGQAGTYDPKKGGKFSPTTKAVPPVPPHREDEPDDKPGSGRKRPHRPR